VIDFDVIFTHVNRYPVRNVAQLHTSTYRHPVSTLAKWSTPSVSRQRLRRTFSSTITTFCWCIAIACVTPTLAMANDVPDDRPPTSLEQTLAEHVCNRVQSSDPRDDVHEQCISLQFHALRAEFGYDLDRLSPGERGHVDSTCSRLRKPESVDAYLNCVTSFLVAAREQRRGADGMAPAAIGEVTFGIPSIPTHAAPPPPSKGHWGLVLGILFLVLAAAGGGAFWYLRIFKKRTPAAKRLCQKCGDELNAAGNLCSTCRHEAGVAAKQAIAERAAEERAELERKRVEREQGEERKRELDQQVADADRQEELRRQDEMRRQEEFRRHQAAAVASAPPPAPAPLPVAAIGAEVDDEAAVEHDPYRVLGIAQGASRQEIESAYSVAASKYDETKVAHLPDAIQAHYRAKADAVEQAYRSLTGTAA
jgi:hypothetical protein